MQKIFDWIMEFLYGIAVIAIGWLPNSPFDGVVVELTPFHAIMGWINYFVPIGTMLTIMATYLTGVLIWYAARWILRLTRYID